MSSAFLSWAALAAMRALVVASVVAPLSVVNGVRSRPANARRECRDGDRVSRGPLRAARRSRRGRPGPTRSRSAVDEMSRRGIETSTHRQSRTESGRSAPVARPRHAPRPCTGRAQIVHAVPGVEARRRVGADDQEQLTAGGRELLDRVDRVRRARPVDLDRATARAPRRRRPRRAPSRARVSRRDDRAALLPRVARDDEDHPIECELLARFERGHEMADVHRIEGAPEDPEALGVTHDAAVYEDAVMICFVDGSVNGA